MSKVQVNAFFEFCRVKITSQRFHMESNLVFIEAESDKRYNPICHNYGFTAKKIPSYSKRMVRNLNIRMNAYTSFWLRLSFNMPTRSLDTIDVGWW
jgi:hypothetical protein